MSEIGRRSALRLIGAAPLAVGFGLTGAEASRAAEQAARAVAASRKGAAYKPKFFTAHEWDTVRVLVDLILPRDERSGSATDAGVPEFMDFFLTDSNEDDRSRESRQTAMRGGLAWIDAECRRRFGKDFVECAEGEKAALLDDIAYSKGDEEDDEALRDRRPQVLLRHGPNFFNSFRDLTASGFWSSKIGVEDLGYKGNTFLTEFPSPPEDVLKKLGLVVALLALLAPRAASAADVGSWPIHQLHVEWMAPAPPEGQDQDRGNSGVFLMGQYEVQVLDSYQSATYPDGQAAAVFGQYPPLVNASRPPGQWQTYDIVFHAPRFDADGKATRPARLTVLHNGVLVQDDVELTGPTAHKSRPSYKAHPAKLPISLQDHDHPVRYRNIWIRELAE